MDLIEAIKQCRRTATPLVAITSTDPAVTRRKVLGAVSDGTADKPAGKLTWDPAAGIAAATDAGKAVLTELEISPGQLKAAPEFLQRVLAMPPRTLIVAVGLAQYAAQQADKDRFVVNQLLFNLRDALKVKACTLVLIDPAHRFDAIVQRDVWMLDDPPPTPDELGELAKLVFSKTVQREPEPAEVERAIAATRGLPASLSEQALYMAMRREGLDFDDLWERKRVMIGQAPGLSVYRGKETFSDVAGYAQVKKWARLILQSPELKPNLVVFLDEAEKAMAGATSGSGDNTGAAQGILQSFLTEMQDRRYHGGMFLGPPGSGKSAIAKALGNEAGCPTIIWDVNGMKSSGLGDTEAATRQAFATILAASGGRAFFVATCNRIETLPPEFRRRFKRGVFYFDLPTADERAAIWEHYLARFGLVQPLPGDGPNDAGWTGAEIEACCENAAYLRIPLKEAAQFIVPVARSAAEEIKALRRLSHGRFLSASEPGPYNMEQSATPVIDTTGLRAFNEED